MPEHTPNEILAVWSAGCGSPGCISSRLDYFHVSDEQRAAFDNAKDFNPERDLKSAQEKLETYLKEPK